MRKARELIGAAFGMMGVVAVAACSAFFDSSGFSDGGESPDTDAGADVSTVSDAVVAPDRTSPNLVEGGADSSRPPVTSCAGLAKTCGPAFNADCCASNVVTGGEAFNRSNNASYPTTISSFRLDVYLVTVGRFRAFVDAGKGTQASPPAGGSGAADTTPPVAWLGSDLSNLPLNTDALKAALKCDPAIQNWTDVPDANESKPINCVSWFESYAFCIWDGGRLPTEAEWNYAAAGGNEQRLYPWGATPPPDSLHARYNSGSTSPVGTYSPLGDGRWGHADLSGNVWEWTLDWLNDPYRFNTCNDCVDLQNANDRAIRGGSFQDSEEYLTTARRGGGNPSGHGRNNGIRCVRPL